MQAFAQETPCEVDRIDANVAHDSGGTGGGASIAIMDTGIDPSYKDLSGNLGEGASVIDCSDNCEEP